MTPTFKKFGILALFTAVIAILVTTWWVNGAEREDLWLYGISIWLVLYAAYETFSAINKDKGDR